MGLRGGIKLKSLTKSSDAIGYSPWSAPPAPGSETGAGRQAKARNAAQMCWSRDIGEEDHNSHIEEGT